MLGFGCNFNCKYCLQHDFRTPTIINHPSKEFYEIIDREARRKQKHDNILTTVHFFGGEPLVYKDIMVEIISKLEEMNSPVHFSMISNGSLIDESFVKYIKEHNISVSISWDGRNTINTRLRDVFKENKKILFKIHNLGISGVLSAYNYPKEFLKDIYDLNNEYYKFSNTWINWNLDPIYDLNNKDKELYNINFDKLYNQSEDIITNYLYDKEKNLPTENDYINKIVFRIKNYKEPKDDIHPCCGNGRNIINIDLNGNLYLCHNTDLKLGDIKSSIISYENNYTKYNKIPYFYNKYCSSCNIRFVCSGGCMIVGEEERNTFYCKLQNSLYYPIISKLLEFYL